ncbi:type I-F CRISPR-associated helicase Cas3f [Psychrobacter sp. UBA5136]|uniref:type I-F CRISPR-associated helicase Cas3f n=1 Tax=Psychrobacter sp. UBA5136 TaxID=1947356 RepID=UPI0025FC20E4|nr:type I-F CRISPR-associated helicase Cas3f [Psychrobacter sp. UBA5136]
MIVTFVSQCEKKSLKRTRRILDSFANRIGDNVWQTAITEDGLQTVKQLLRKSATKSTAVSCHRNKTRQLTELVWIVGNKRKFNEIGVVPVNWTAHDVSMYQDKNLWKNLELVALASGIAGLFHDFGKANDLFQNKLNPNKPKDQKNYEPYRHEWVSLKLFEAIVQHKTCEQWLELLLTPNQINELDTIECVQNPTFQNNFNNRTGDELNCFANYDDFTKLVAWLIVSHHRLLVYPYFQENPPPLTPHDELAKNWLKDCDVKWNSPNIIKHYWTEKEKAVNWQFSLGLPLQSKAWQKKTIKLANHAKQSMMIIKNFNWQQDTMTAHLARTMLMVADHNYSSQEANTYFQDKCYLAYANTDAERQLKQRLDEHNLMVGHQAYNFSHKLPHLISELPTIEYNRILERGFDNADVKLSRWQDKSVSLCQRINKSSNEGGFFGINMASTGKGKTFANARIMYALADGNKGFRLSIALGLRTLTTQTGKALSKDLRLDKEDIATLIGSSAILKLLNKSDIDETKDNQLLQEQRQLLEELEKSALAMRGSESLELNNDFEVDYDEEIKDNTLLKQWFDGDPKYQKLLYAPILVSTIDYIIPATEGLRGGKQIAPILRLLSSDLVLDEPDEFGLADLPALCRLVNWAGMLGSKVLLSSATIPPAMANGLFDAYLQGRAMYNRSMMGNSVQKPVTCAWFDEFDVHYVETQNINEQLKAHKQFVNKRAKKLVDKENIISRKAKILSIVGGETTIERLTNTIHLGLFEAHKHHYQSDGQHNISIGVVRFANINPLIEITDALIAIDNPDDTCIHYCVYHSQFTLAMRSFIETKLDNLLNRKQADAIWKADDIVNIINRNPKVKNHIFVVLATSVCEVGRDHDYDWAIAEPSSMRSLIQLAGRIQRHRKQAVDYPNLFILDKNFKALDGKSIAFARPGFESRKYNLVDDKSITHLLTLDQYQHINAIPSIDVVKPKPPPYKNLVSLEQSTHWFKIMGLNHEENNAKLWWENHISWTGELQRQQPFRLSSPEMTFVYVPDTNGRLTWYHRADKDYHKLIKTNFITACIDPVFGHNNDNWFNNDEMGRYEAIAQLLDLPLEKIPYTYGEVKVPYYKASNKQFYYHPFFGVFS